MKIVFLNVLNAEVTEPLKLFLQTHLPDTDVFCFQECFENMLTLLTELGFSENFAELSATKLVHSETGPFINMTFVRKTLPVTKWHSNMDTTGTGLDLFSTINYGGKEVHIANMHGLSRPGKLDNEARLKQSQELIDAFDTLEGIKIIGGDLNVLLDTESVKLFEKAGYRNLIRDFDIKTTRNELSWSKYPGNELYYSDYVFIKGADAASFEVPPEIVSDHQPMILTVNI